MTNVGSRKMVAARKTGCTMRGTNRRLVGCDVRVDLATGISALNTTSNPDHVSGNFALITLLFASNPRIWYSAHLSPARSN